MDPTYTLSANCLDFSPKKGILYEALPNQACHRSGPVLLE